MSVYNEKDFDHFKENIDSVLDEVEKKKLELFEPTGDEIQKVNEIIMQFIKDNKRKIYGGLAMHMLINEQKPDNKDIIYPGSKDKLADIDFYSPDPIVDLMKLCNILYEKGFKNVIGTEGQHIETYKIFVNYGAFCDISYVPKNIYNRMPYKEVNGIYCIHPNWMAIDYFRMLSDPLISYWRIEKGFKRFIKLQKYYPLPHSEKPIIIKYQHEDTNSLKKILNTMQEYIANKNSLISVGFYAYNHYLLESGLLNSKDKIYKKFKLVDIPYLELISTNYRQDSLDFINNLKLKHPELAQDIIIEEHYPFFSYFGHHVYIYYKNNLIGIIYNNNKLCVPYKSVPAIKFINNKQEKLDGQILIGSFSNTLYYTLATVMKVRTDNDDKTKDLYITLLSHLIEMRSYYFKKNNKNLFDKTLFQDFIVDCKGETMAPERERRLIIETRKKKGKPYTFKYEPENDVKEPESSYRFANSSGNPIKNIKNLKLGEKEVEQDIEGDIDDEN